MQKSKQELNANLVGANCIRPHFKENTLKNQKGITLIALIITIIVMLILVGVTINVALNGGLFQKAETATYQTEASLVKEQLEIAKAIETANNEGILNDYSFITVENLDNLDQKTINKFKDIILVNSNGDICYNPANVTDKEISMLEAIGINAYENNQLTEEEIEEIEGLILQYATAIESNNTVVAQEAAELLQQKGLRFDEVIDVGDWSMSPYTYYLYEHNLKIMINNENLSIRIPTKAEIEILDELYNIAICFDNELENGRPAASTNFSIIYNGNTIIASYCAGPWYYYLGHFSLGAHSLDTDGKFVGL